MAESTVTVYLSQELLCDSRPAVAGDLVYLYLDLTKYPAADPNPIEGTIVSVDPATIPPDPEGSVSVLTITADDVDFPAGVVELESCDLDRVACLDCCARNEDFILSITPEATEVLKGEATQLEQEAFGLQTNSPVFEEDGSLAGVFELADATGVVLPQYQLARDASGYLVRGDGVRPGGIPVSTSRLIVFEDETIDNTNGNIVTSWDVSGNSIDEGTPFSLTIEATAISSDDLVNSDIYLFLAYDDGIVQVNPAQLQVGNPATQNEYRITGSASGVFNRATLPYTGLIATDNIGISRAIEVGVGDTDYEHVAAQSSSGLDETTNFEISLLLFSASAIKFTLRGIADLKIG